MNPDVPDTASGSSRWNPWPVSIVAFFSVAIVCAIGFVVFCSMHGSELVAADYYEQEIRYESELGRIQSAGSLVVPATISYDAASESLVLGIPESHAVSGVTGTVHLYRAASAGMDRSFVLQPDGQGRQSIPADLAAGPWTVKLRWKSSGAEYQVDQKLVVNK